MAYFNSQVQIALEIGLNSSGPSDTSFSWTDITTDLRQFDIGSGRQFELDDVQAGSASFVLTDSGRAYDPTNAASSVDVMQPVRFKAVHSGTTYHLFRGYAQAWRHEWQPGGYQQTCRLDVVDGFKVLAFHETASTAPQETSGTRIGRHLDNAGWSTSLRNIGTGDTTCAAYTPDCSFVLAEIQRVVKTEDGSVFFMDGQGQATFHDQSHRTGSTSIATFTDTGGGLPYRTPLMRSYDDENLWNDVTVAGVNTSPQASESTASVDAYGRRKYRRFDTLHVNATAAADTAAELVARYKDPQTRIPAITVDPVGSTGLWPHTLGREIADRITIKQATKTGGTVYNADHHIEGVRHVGDVGNIWETTWLLSPST